jgi:two-component system OmpR family response regulator
MLQILDISFANLINTSCDRELRHVGLQRIQIIEGNPHLRSLLSWHLQQAGFLIQQFASIHQVRTTSTSHQPALVIVDSDLPDGDGVELCRWLYQQRQSLILMLSARTGERDIVNALQAGADDYLAKPFGMQEFMARVEALLRRLRLSCAPLQLNYGDLRIDLVQRRVHCGEKLIELTPQEFSLLYILVQAEGQPLSRTELLQRAWPDAIDNPRTIDTHVLSLRKKVEPDPRDPKIIQTVRNVGYRFNPQMLQETQMTSDLASGSTQQLNHNGHQKTSLSAKNLAVSQPLS